MSNAMFECDFDCFNCSFTDCKRSVKDILAHESKEPKVKKDIKQRDRDRYIYKREHALCVRCGDYIGEYVTYCPKCREIKRKVVDEWHRKHTQV